MIRGQGQRGHARLPGVVHRRSPLVGLDARPDQHLDGLSFVPLLRGAEALEREAIFWHYPHYHGSGSRPFSAIRARDDILFRWYGADSHELFRLGTDLSERQQIAFLNPDRRPEFSRLLDEWLRQSGARLPQKPEYSTHPSSPPHSHQF